MSKINTWVKRFRSARQAAPRQQILANGKAEILTATQACRFQQLQNLHLGRKPHTGRTERARPHYPIADASRQLGVSVERILLAAAAGDLQCYLTAPGLRGRWRIGASNAEELRAEAVEMPPYLALTPSDCRDIEAYGSANVTELDYPAGRDRSVSEFGEHTRYCLLEPLWVDPERIVLRHPLPELAKT